jgi:hypothetical protein
MGNSSDEGSDNSDGLCGSIGDLKMELKKKQQQQNSIGMRHGQLNPPGQINNVNTIMKICICGLPCRADQENCDSCEGKNSVQLEGEIYKKQKSGGSVRKYWFVLLGKELYSYK